jgi:hypothetical protein
LGLEAFLIHHPPFTLPLLLSFILGSKLIFLLEIPQERKEIILFSLSAPSLAVRVKGIVLRQVRKIKFTVLTNSTVYCLLTFEKQTQIRLQNQTLEKTMKSEEVDFLNLQFSFYISVHSKVKTLYEILANAEKLSVADPDPGSGAFLTPGSGIRN